MIFPHSHNDSVFLTSSAELSVKGNTLHPDTPSTTQTENIYNKEENRHIGGHQVPAEEAGRWQPSETPAGRSWTSSLAPGLLQQKHSEKGSSQPYRSEMDRGDSWSETELNREDRSILLILAAAHNLFQPLCGDDWDTFSHGAQEFHRPSHFIRHKAVHVWDAFGHGAS